MQCIRAASAPTYQCGTLFPNQQLPLRRRSIVQRGREFRPCLIRRVLGRILHLDRAENSREMAVAAPRVILPVIDNRST